MNKSICLLILITITLIGCSEKTFEYEPKFIKSEIITHNIKEGQEFTFGYLEVPENRQNPNTKTVRLPIKVGNMVPQQIGVIHVQ